MSEREAREVGFLRRHGHTGDAIAGRMGRDHKTVNAAIHARGLDGLQARRVMALRCLRRECDVMAGTLEDQVCRFGAEGATGSPDRVDAFAWAVWALRLERGKGPRIRAL